MSLACRFGDLDIMHCSLPARAQGSPNVRVNGQPWSCETHVNGPHLRPAGTTCVAHVAPIMIGSASVIINGLPAGRIGDPISGCTAVAQGSPNVRCGFF
jgi:uncharacterized Zn-binding protein involved in type VI secretion